MTRSASYTTLTTRPCTTGATLSAKKSRILPGASFLRPIPDSEHPCKSVPSEATVAAMWSPRVAIRTDLTHVRARKRCLSSSGDTCGDRVSYIGRERGDASIVATHRWRADPLGHLRSSSARAGGARIGQAPETPVVVLPGAQRSSETAERALLAPRDRFLAEPGLGARSRTGI